MKRKWITCFAIVLAALLAFEIAHSIFALRRFVYQGRTAKWWLGEVFTTNQSAAFQAFQKMGTNAFPMLVENLKKHRDSTLDKFYQEQYPEMPPSLQKYFPRPLTAEMARSSAAVILMNSKDISSIMPELAGQLKHRNAAANANIIMCFTQRLSVRDTNYIPLLIECLSDSDRYVRISASSTLGRFGGAAKSAVPELMAILSERSPGVNTDAPSMEAARALWHIDPNTKDADCTVLKEYLAAGDIHTRHRAAVYLGELDPTDLSAIPLILETLQQRDRYVETEAAIAIGNYKAGAKAWVPELVKIIESGPPDSSMWGIRQTLIRSLKMIDPEAAAKYEKK